MHVFQLVHRYGSKHSLSSSTRITLQYYYYEAIQLCPGRRLRTLIICSYLNLFSHSKISMKKTHVKISRRTRDLNLLGGAVWILPGVAKILATLLSTRAFATDERGRARVLMHPPARALETSSHELCFFVPPRCPSRSQTDRRPANYAIQP